MKNIYHHYAWMFGHIYRFIDGLINNSKEFEKSFMEIYPVELELKKENANKNVATSLDLSITIKE